jgi:beta-phosphoglucomutase
MKYKAIIFDMDGTIIETNHIWTHVTHKLITVRGGTITPEIAHTLSVRLAGLSGRECCAIIKEVTGIPGTIDELLQEKSKIAHDAFEEGIRFVDGFVPFHGTLKAHDLKSGLATNASTATVSMTNKKLNLTQFFGDHLYNISHVNFVGKPNPAVYLHAAKQLQVDPACCIAIEDSAHGIQAAKNAGMFCIGINTARKPELLTMADIIVDTYDEIDLAMILTNQL